MQQGLIEETLQSLGFNVNDFSIDKLSLQLEQINQKIKKVQNMPQLKELAPTFLLEQRRDDHVNK